MSNAHARENRLVHMQLRIQLTDCRHIEQTSVVRCAGIMTAIQSFA
jgi:hypothetical protein